MQLNCCRCDQGQREDVVVGYKCFSVALTCCVALIVSAAQNKYVVNIVLFYDLQVIFETTP